MYAKYTEVSVEKSHGHIRKLLNEKKAAAFSIMEDGAKAAVLFQLQGRRIVFKIPMPERARLTQNQYEQRCRQKWRGLLLVLKAKFEAVESGITTLEEEFLAHIMLPNGHTFGEWAVPQIAESYKNNQMPPLMIGGSV